MPDIGMGKNVDRSKNIRLSVGGWIVLSVPICLRPFTYICVDMLVTLIFAELIGCDLIKAVKMGINGR